LPDRVQPINVNAKMTIHWTGLWSTVTAFAPEVWHTL